MNNEVQVYAVKHKKLETRMASRSGGIFTAISDSLLSQNGVIYGCVLNESFEAVHVRAENAEERDRMRGSKYVQSNLGDTFRQVQNDLKDNRLVLFSGTSCQAKSTIICFVLTLYVMVCQVRWYGKNIWSGSKKEMVLVSQLIFGTSGTLDGQPI
jgi:hypothetical protein